MRLRRRKPNPLRDEDVIPAEQHHVHVVPVAVPVHEDDLHPDDLPIVADPVPVTQIADVGDTTRDDRRKAIRKEMVRILTKHHENGVTIPNRQRVLVEDKDFAQAWINGEVKF